jgi:hypothetical protein
VASLENTVPADDYELQVEDRAPILAASIVRNVRSSSGSAPA